MNKKIINGINTVFQDPLSYKVAVVSSMAIAYLFYWLLYKVTTLPTMVQMTKDGEFGKYSYTYFATYWLITLATIILFGISVSMLVWLWRRSLLSNVGKSSSGLGAFTGVFTGALGAACPVCGGFLLSLLGVSAGVSLFPLQGLELNFLSLGFIGASTAYAAQKVTKAVGCEECVDISKNHSQAKKPRVMIFPLEKIFVFGLAALFLLNQLLIGQVAAFLEMTPKGNFVATIFNIKTASTMTIIAPKVNPDGKTTSLVEWPTITEVSANPNTGNALADAKVVMIAAGKPFYAPDDIVFDDPINAQKKWGAFETSIKLSTEQEARYQKLISTMMTCSYCCGGPNNVTMNKNCGCAHAKAVRGFYRFMIQNYGDKYSDEQMVGESHRWYALWYPKGMLEDYLLATGNESALPHESHGGAGPDNMHGLRK